MNKIFLFFIVISFSIQCSSPKATKEQLSTDNKYAKYFKINKHNGQSQIQICSTIDTTNITTYTFDNQSVSPHEIQLPRKINKVICLSTTHIAFIKALGKIETIVGITNPQLVTDSSVINRINAGEIADIGYEHNLNFELIKKLSPDIIFTYSIAGEKNIHIEKLNSLGFTTVSISEFIENHPVGKSEWIKVFGEIYNQPLKADSIFQTIENKYNKAKSNKVQNNPRILVGLPYQGTWYIPGGNSYLAKLISDAGGEYIWHQNNTVYSRPVSIETIFSEAIDADIWINTGTINTQKEILMSDVRLKKLKPFQANKIFNNNKGENRFGGIPFWEQGVIEPDVILKDLIAIFSAASSIDSSLVYFKQIDQ